AAAGSARAQPVVTRISSSPGIGTTIGLSGNGDQNSEHSGLDLDLFLDAPIASALRIRADVGRASWLFDGYDPRRTRAPARDTVTVTRATIGAVKLVPSWDSRSPLRAYTGAAVGLYHYGFEAGSARHTNQPGVSLLAGLEFAGDGPTIVAEVQLHAIGRPNAPHGAEEPPRNQVFSNVPLGLNAL